MTKFVNPYTFVPLPDAIKKEPLQMHDGSGAKDKDLYTGRFVVQWELKSSLLLPENAEAEGWLELIGKNVGRIRVPGSSVKGAMRSLHEAIFFGCMSVVDQNYIPVYREASVKGQRTDDDEWVIGVVEDIDENGKPLRIRPSKGGTAWVNAEVLPNIGRPGNIDENKLPQTGDIIQFPESITKNGRRKVDKISSFRPRHSDSFDGYMRNDHVLIITDGGTRQKLRTWHWASQEIDKDSPLLAISKDAWKHFEAKVDGTEDRRKEKLKLRKNGGFPAAEKVQVQGLGKVLGKRLSQNGVFAAGDALWVKIGMVDGEKKVTELSYSAIWRRVAVFPEGDERAGEVMHLGDLLGDLGPCDPNSDEGVCLSCSLFGAVGPEKEEGEKGLGYAGHVRFGSLELDSSLQEDGVDISPKKKIMPLSSPKPSNGQFYMTNPRRLRGEPTLEMADDGETTSHWDRRRIKHVDRKLAGRKFYWNHKPDRKYNNGRLHYEKFEGASDELTTERRFVFAGDKDDKVIFKGEVIFDQITGAQLASLWCLLNPSSLFESFNVKGPDVPVVRLGGGKPLGFGSVAPRIVSHQVYNSVERYTGKHAEFGDSNGENLSSYNKRWKSLTSALERRVIADGDSKKLVNNIKMLNRLMDLDGLGDAKELVTYPPGASWSQYGTKKFHETYRFFVENRGLAGGGKNGTYWGEWMPLPVLKPTDRPQHMPDDQTLDW